MGRLLPGAIIIVQLDIPPDFTSVVAIAGGGEHTITLLEDSTVVVIGGIHNQTNVPAGLTNVVAVAAGSSHCLALRSDATVVAWGNEALGRTNVPVDLTNVVAIAAGEQHSLALQANGNLTVWGQTLPPTLKGCSESPRLWTEAQPSVPTGYRSYGMCPGRMVPLF